MPLNKRRLQAHKSRGGIVERVLPERVEVGHIERCKLCGSVAHFFRYDGWYYAQCYKNRIHRGQMYRTSMEALTDWNNFNKQ